MSAPIFFNDIHSVFCHLINIIASQSSRESTSTLVALFGVNSIVRSIPYDREKE